MSVDFVVDAVSDAVSVAAGLTVLTLGTSGDSRVGTTLVGR